ncbi:MAG: hypothetical protein ACPGNV_00745 [Mangrovicoccus sp.]
MFKRPTRTLASLTALTLAVSACATIDDATASLSGKTEKRTTVRLDYNDVAHSTEEAQAKVRELCGASEVVSVSQPVVIGENLYRVTAECFAEFDRDGNML